MAETRKKSTTTTKTKTVPTKKPTTKPAGKSVKPKATKTVTAKATKTTSATTKASAAPAKKHSLAKIVFSIIVAVAVVAVATCIIANVICKNQIVMIENGKGDKVATKYISLDKKYEALVPTSFKKVSDADVKAEFGEDSSALVYRNDDDTAYISFIAPDEEIEVTNEQLSSYVELMKTILSATAKVSGVETYESNGHNVSIITFTIEASGEKAYSQMALFSYEDRLASVTFSCTDSARAEWEKVSNEIMKSIRFNK